MKQFLRTLSGEKHTAKRNLVLPILSILFLFVFGNGFAQTTGIYESYAIINANGAGNTYYDLSAVTANPDFQGANLGTFTASQTLVLAGGQNKTFKCSGGNVTGSNIYYRVYSVSGIAGSFSSAIAYGFTSNDTGGCGGNQTWTNSTNTTNVKAGLSPGVYYLEVYADAPGSPGTVYANNGGANYKATFTVSSALSVYDFTGATTGAATTNATGGTLSVMSSNNNNGTVTAISATSASSGYTGASGTNNIGNAPLGGALNTGTSGYFEFTITPPSGGSVVFNSITFGSRGTGTAPTNYAIRTSADSYAANVATGTLAITSTWTLMSPTVTTVTGAAGAALTIRIYGYGGTGAAANTIVWRIDDINIVTGLSYNPALNASSSSLAFSTTQAVGTTTTSQTFNLTGSNLTGFPGSITVSAPSTDFQVSNNNSTWGATATIAYTTASLASTPVYVRFSPQSSGAKSGNVTFSGGGVSTPPTVVVTGTAILGTPVATAATNITTTSFDANWGAVTGASSGYLLDVSTSPTFGTTGSASLSEGFSAGTTAPTGWTFTGAVSTYTSAGNFGASSPSIQMNATGEVIQTIALSGAATQLSFWLKGNSTDAVSALLVEGYNGSSWVTVQNITSSIPTTGTTYTYNSGTTPALPSNITQFRFTYTKSAGNIAFDDVAINYSTSTPSFVTGYNAKPIAGQSTVTSTVTGLSANTIYYYRLRATDGTPSSYSNVITVNPASIGGTVSSDQTICSGTQPSTLTLAGNNGTIIKWQKASDSAFTSPTDITNTTATLTGSAIGTLTTTTYFRAVVQSYTNPTANAVYATVTVTALPTYANLQYPATGSICETGTFNAYGQVYQLGVTEAAGAGPGITAQFGYSTSNTDPSTWTNWSAASFNIQVGNNDEYTYAFTPPSAGTYYYTFRYRQGTCIWLYGGYNGGFWNGTTNVNGVLTVNPNHTIALTSGSSTPTVCQSAALVAPIVYTVGGGATGAGVTGLPTGITGTFSGSTLTLNGAPTVTGTFNYTVTTTGNACTVATATGTITVNPNVTPTFTAVAAICSGGSLSALPTTSNNGITGTWSPALNNTTTTTYTFTPTAGQCATTTTLTITVNPFSTASIVSNNSPICSGSTASFVLSGTSGNVVTYNINGGSSSTITFTSSSATINVTGATSTQTLNLVSVNNGYCTASLSGTSTVSLGATTTWNGTSWDNGLPTSTSAAIIAGNYTSSGDLNACTLEVTSGATVVITSGDNVSLNGALTVDTGCTFTLSNNANLLQATNATNSGNITVHRDSNSLYRQDYTMWSSPVTGSQTLQAFSPSTLAARFYNYNTSTNLYNVVTSPSTTTFDLGAGYLIRTPNTFSNTVAAIYAGSFPGVPNNGNVSVALNYYGTGLGFNMIGNPYPSTVDADTFISANTANIESTLYFWRKTNAASGSAYATYNSLGSTATATSATPNGILQVGQGFIVEAKNTNGVTFTNTMRTADNANQFFKNTTIEKDRMWLNLTNTAGLFTQTLLGYMTGATQGIDSGIDGKYINDSPVSLTSIINGTDYVIQGRALPFDASDVVPLDFKTDTAGDYTIGLDHFDGLFAAGQNIYLRDNTNGAIQDLKAGSYTFTTTAGTFDTRFDVIYQTTLSTTNPIFNDSAVVVFKNHGTIYVNAGASILDNVKVFDIRGRLITEKSKINANQVAIDGTKYANQVLILQITSDTQERVTKKIVN